MAKANAKANFKPRTSNNIIEGATPVDETQVNNTEVGEVTETPINNEETPSVEKAEEVTPPVKEETQESPAVTFEDKTDSKSPAPKNVKVCLKEDHSCFIGGVHYHFTKGKQTNVPESVKTILMKADLLMPL